MILGDLNPSQDTMTNTYIIRRDDQGNMTKLQYAKVAKWDPQQKAWVMKQADSLEIPLDRQPSEVRKTDVVYRTELSPVELTLRNSATYLRFQSTARLTEMLQQDYIRRRMGQTLELEKHIRFTNPLINVILLLLAAPLIVSREPGNVFMEMVKALLVIITGFGVTFACQQLGGQQLSPLLATWMPVFIFGPLAVLVLDSVKT